MVNHLELSSKDFSFKPNRWYGITPELINRVRKGAVRRYEVYQKIIWRTAVREAKSLWRDKTGWPLDQKIPCEALAPIYHYRCHELGKEVVALRALLQHINYQRQQYIQACDRLIRERTITQEELDDAMAKNDALIEYIWGLPLLEQDQMYREEIALTRQKEAAA